MSRQTNKVSEPSVSCGFYDSLNGDRKYYASQMSRIFDGVINDGIFASIKPCLVVTAGSGNIVNVGAGKAWFDHTFTENDAPLPIDCGDMSKEVLDRIDAIIIETDANENVRDNFIKLKMGTKSSSPVRPTMERTEKKNQYPLCYIYRKAGSVEIRQADITNMVGTDETPFITGLLEVVSLDQLLGQWQDELDRFVENEKKDLAVTADELDEWMRNQKASILAWYNELVINMSDNVAINLQFQIDREEVERILTCGFTDGVKTFSDDGLVITSIDTKGRKLVKTFEKDFSSSTTELTDKEGGYIATMVKTYSSDLKSIETEITVNNISNIADGLSSETWVFTLDDDSTVEKEVIIKDKE